MNLFILINKIEYKKGKNFWNIENFKKKISNFILNDSKLFE